MHKMVDLDQLITLIYNNNAFCTIICKLSLHNFKPHLLKTGISGLRPSGTGHLIYLNWFHQLISMTPSDTIPHEALGGGWRWAASQYERCVINRSLPLAQALN